MANPKGETILINNQEVKLIPLGYCACGCGGRTTNAKYNDNRHGAVKGKPLRFIKGHNGANNKNSRIVTNGYISIWDRNIKTYKYEHISICEKALGKAIPPGTEVHHVNGKKDDNRNCNLVLCQDRTYHLLLEQRTRAYKACGHANWRMCWICQTWDNPINLYIPKRGYPSIHINCNNLYQRNKRKERNKK